jgi:hypothetical protein
MSNINTNTEPFYTPPTTPEGLRDYRLEITRWKEDKAQRDTLGRYPIDALIIIDNLLDALDKERKDSTVTSGNMRDQHDAIIGRLKQNLWASKGRTA